MIELNEIKTPVILFDGVCNLCCSSVQFIIKRDQRKYFRFASLQSDFGKNILRKFELNENNINSFILVEDGKLFTRSTAALKVSKQLSGSWKILYAFINSFILMEDGKLFTRSTAALNVAKQLSGAWKIMYVFIIIQSFIRNYFYSVIANNRYKWFGKKEECWLPGEEKKDMFID